MQDLFFQIIIKSNVNTKRIKEFIDLEIVQPTGLAAFQERNEKERVFTPLNRISLYYLRLTKKILRQIKSMELFTSKALWYQRTAVNW